MSVRTASARPGPAFASISAATASSRSISGAARTTRAPAFASASDIDRPSPTLAPVMATTVPSRSIPLIVVIPLQDVGLTLTSLANEWLAVIAFSDPER